MVSSISIIKPLSTMLQMISSRRCRPSHPTVRDGFVAVFAIAFAVAGCASAPAIVEVAPKSIARRLGLSDCRVSVPLSQSDVINLVKRWDNHPSPEENQEWIEITAKQQPGDQLRMVSCKSGDPYFYALIRNDMIISKFHPVFLD